MTRAYSISIMHACRVPEKIATYLLIPELNQPRLVLHNLDPMTFTIIKQLGQCKPLPSHLVPIIGIHKLIIIYTITRIPLHPLNGRPAAVQLDDVVNEFLTRFGEGERFGGVRLVVLGWVGLAGLVVFARGGGRDGGIVDGGIGGHGERCGCELTKGLVVCVEAGK